MLLIPKIYYNGDRDKALNLKGAALQFYTLLSQQPETIAINGIKKSKRLNDDSIIEVQFTQSAYHVHSKITIYAKPGPSGQLFSGFLIKERDEAGELTGKKNLLQTDKNGYVTTLKDVALDSDLTVWANHSEIDPILSAQQYQNGKKVIDDIAGEVVLLSWKALGETFYLTQKIAHETSTLGSEANVKPVTLRIKGKTQTFVLPFDLLDVIFADASSTGLEFLVFTRLADAELRNEAGEIIGYPADFDYDLVSQGALVDKWELIVRYEISKQESGDYVFTNIYTAYQWQGYCLEEIVTGTSTAVTELYNQPLIVQCYYVGKNFTAIVFNANALTVTSLIAADNTGIFLSFSLGDKTLLFAQTTGGASNEEIELYRLNPRQRYSFIKPYLKTINDGENVATSAIDSSDIASFTGIAFRDFPIVPFNTPDYATSKGILDSVGLNLARFDFRYGISSTPDISYLIDPHISWIAPMLFRAENGTSSFKQVLYLCPRGLFAQAVDFGFIGDPNNHEYEPLNADFTTVLTDKFTNHLVISYGSDYDLGGVKSAVDPVVTIKVVTKKLTRINQPVTHVLKRSDIIGVI